MIAAQIIGWIWVIFGIFSVYYGKDMNTSIMIMAIANIWFAATVIIGSFK